ncbi:MAG TPA: hypothetical protein PLM41_20930, partial [Saprospiraceae bacterium]|nr:hypothetical protein [Saprospiraceae bacterium]
MQNFTHTSFSLVQRRAFLGLVVAACCWCSPAAAQICSNVYNQADVDNFNCTTVEGDLFISGFDINNLNGLSELTHVSGRLVIVTNQFLVTLDGLNNLTSVGGLQIVANQSLYNLAGLDNLSFVGGEMTIVENQNLQSLIGLDHAISGIGFLNIIDNPQLLSCSVQSVCDYLGGSNSVNICCNGFECNDEAQVEAACALAQPVELTYFRATIPETGRYALLTWRTASERNNLGFDIERSSDGRTWQTLALVPGHGTTQEEQSYAYTDERPQPGENYYRLKQVDFDGKFEYSDIRSVVMGSGAKDEVGIYPNPTHSGLVSLDYYAEKEGDLSVSVFDALGRLMIL